MRRLLILGLLLLCVQAFASDKGNGGGGIYFDGRYMTFGSAGTSIGAEAISLDEIPQLQETIDLIVLSPLGHLTKANYIKALSPKSNRQYYKLNPEDLNEGVMKNLLDIYAKLFQVNTDRLTIYAVTNTETRETFLLPNFFKLNAAEKMAILYHEASWIMYPREDYKNIVRDEIAFQAYVENRNSNELLMAWITKAAYFDDQMSAAIKIDMETKALSPMLSSEGSIATKQLLGLDFIECSKSYTSGAGEYCAHVAVTHIQALMKKYPSSQFLKVFQFGMMNLNFTIGGSCGKKDLEESQILPNAVLDLKSLRSDSLRVFKGEFEGTFKYRNESCQMKTFFSIK